MGLRELRKKRGLTLEAVSVLSGNTVDVATVSRIERGLVTPRAATTVALARALGVSAKRMHAILSESDLVSTPRRSA